MNNGWGAARKSGKTLGDTTQSHKKNFETKLGKTGTPDKAWGQAEEGTVHKVKDYKKLRNVKTEIWNDRTTDESYMAEEIADAMSATEDGRYDKTAIRKSKGMRGDKWEGK